MWSDVTERNLENERAGDNHLTLGGGLMVGGWLLAIVATLFHPSGHEDNHRAIFAEYADSGAWVTVHVVQFIGVLLALAGLLVLRDVMVSTGRATALANVAATATVATAATWAMLQGLDGVGLKQAVDAWAGSSGPERAIRLADAEVIRWLEWGFQSYFRMLLGLTFVLFGAALLVGRLLPGWLGGASALAGLLSVLIGLDVGYNGLASGIQDVAGIAFLVVGLVFAVGVLVTGLRGRRPSPDRREPDARGA